MSVTPKRTVSFGPSESSAPTSSSLSATPTTGAAALKPALKPGTDRKKLPPQEQYQHPDPLLRRLRLVDANGHPVDLKRAFRDTKVVGFYFASQWAGQPLKEYHKTISDFCLRHPHEFKAIYVSVDVDEQWYKAGTKDKPWISMVWNDGSSMPTERQDQTTPDQELDELPKLYNNEDFLLANETDIDESLSHTDKSGEAYLRPFSRVHLAAKLNIIAAPTLCIYHIPSGKMLESNVRTARLSPGNREETWQNWLNGERASSFSLSDAFRAAPYTWTMTVLVIFYYIFIRIAGDEYNILRTLLYNLLADRTTTQAPKSEL